ncbi:MAG: glycosyltransferase [bacterium]
MTNLKYFFIWHANFRGDDVSDPNPGITNAFLDKYFSEKSYIIIRHSLFRGGKTKVTFKNSEIRNRDFSHIGLLPDPLRYVVELMFNFYYVLAYGRGRVFLCIDPLSAFVPVLLKKIGYVKKVVFLTPDFSKKRFQNPLLNGIYFALDAFCTRGADVNVCNSSEVIRYKKEIYKNKGITYFHMPNVPPPWIVEKYKSIQKVAHKVIYVGNLGDDINLGGFKELFAAIHESSKDYPDITLFIAGGGSKLETLKAIAHDSARVIFLGVLSHEDTLKQIAESEIGIALYNGDNSYDEFRDSLKIREYQAFGTIPITTDVVKSNVEEIRSYGSGIILERFDKDSVLAALVTSMDPTKSAELQRKASLNHELQQDSFNRFLEATGFEL